MSSNATLELALRDEPQAVMLTNKQLIVIAQTDFVPKGLRGNVPAVLACVARGRAMGIPDMIALSGIAIIEGKATLSAELMVAIVREHGHSITGEVSMTKAVVRGKRKDNGDTMTAMFDMTMAENAGLLNKFNWKKHPDDMLWARAVSKLCRRLFADCFAGGTYTPEEMRDGTDDDPAGLTADEVLDEPRPETEPEPDEDSPDPPLEPVYEPVPDEADDVPSAKYEPYSAPPAPSGFTFTAGRYEGKTLQEVWDEGEDGIRYLKWALRNWQTGPLVDELRAFAVEHPEIRA